MPNKLSTQVGIVLSFIIFSLIAILVPKFGSNGQVEVILGAATFIYGIIVAFFISFATNRLNEVSQLLNSEDSTYIAIYRLVVVFGKEKQNEVKLLIDSLLVSSIDHYLRDYYKTKKEFESLVGFVLDLKPGDKGQEQAYSSLLSLIQKTQDNRTRINALVKQEMFLYEWVVLYVLNAVILFCIFYLNNHSFASIAISVLLSTSTVTLLLILRDLTHLRWREQVWIWESLRCTFEEMDLLPYYPARAIKEKRIKLDKGEKCRVVHYPHKYPDFADKEVTEATF